MKMALKPQNLLEWIALKLNLVPIPLVHTQISFVFSRSVLMAFKLNIFEVIHEQSSLTVEQIAQLTQLQPNRLRSLINILVSAGYLKFQKKRFRLFGVMSIFKKLMNSFNNHNTTSVTRVENTINVSTEEPRFSLTKMAKKWCLKNSPNSLYNQQIFNLICWNWMDSMELFLKTGQGLQYHETFTTEEWRWYQLGMADVAKDIAKATVKKIPMPPRPKYMLDIGGSHGLHSVELCKQYPTLKSVILDLPQAVEKAMPILLEKQMGNRVSYWPGNVLEEDLGEDKYTLVLAANVIHHFTKEQCHLLSNKVSRTLKIGGIFVIQEFLRPELSENMDMSGAILDLFFNLSSSAGNWSLEEIKSFQKEAGLKHLRVHRFRTPGYVQICAIKVS